MTTLIVIIKAIVTAVVAYAIGCFSSAYFIGWIKKIDIREHGSGNAGSTNAMRVLGPKAGAIVLLLDVFKGVVATFIGALIFRIMVTPALADTYSRYGIYLSGLFAV
jgi:glycerol-3-phosphate acyltransferase PlsY